eukprot:11122799-Alexandrium_andersonii.AAC.1
MQSPTNQPEAPHQVPLPLPRDARRHEAALRHLAHQGIVCHCRDRLRRVGDPVSGRPGLRHGRGRDPARWRLRQRPSVVLGLRAVLRWSQERSKPATPANALTREGKALESGC